MAMCSLCAVFYFLCLWCVSGCVVALRLLSSQGKLEEALKVLKDGLGAAKESGNFNEQSIVALDCKGNMATILKNLALAIKKVVPPLLHQLCLSVFLSLSLPFAVS